MMPRAGGSTQAGHPYPLALEMVLKKSKVH